MRILVKLFGALGLGEVLLQIEKDSNLYDLLGILIQKYPKLEGKFFRDSELNENFQYLVNGRNAFFLQKGKTKLKDNYEVCIFPPVGGG